jgi:hypothetical protein
VPGIISEQPKGFPVNDAARRINPIVAHRAIAVYLSSTSLLASHATLCAGLERDFHLHVAVRSDHRAKHYARCWPDLRGPTRKR